MATSYSLGKRYGNFIKDLFDSGRHLTASRSCGKGCGFSKNASSFAANLEAL